MHSINRSQTGLFRICCFSLVRESMMMYPNDSNFIGAKFKLEHYANDKIHGFAVTSVFANFFPGVTRRSAGLETLPGQKNRTLLQLEMPQKSVGGLESSSVRQFSSILTREKHGKTEQNPWIFRGHPFLEDAACLARPRSMEVRCNPPVAKGETRQHPICEMYYIFHRWLRWVRIWAIDLICSMFFYVFLGLRNWDLILITNYIPNQKGWRRWRSPNMAPQVLQDQ